MRLSWNEVRARAAAFAEEWKAAAYEKGETQSFYNAFFQVFGVKRRSVARYEAHVAKLDHRSGFIDLFWPGVLIVEQKSAGRDLNAAYVQAGSRRSSSTIWTRGTPWPSPWRSCRATWKPLASSWGCNGALGKRPSVMGPGRVCPATSPERQPAAGGAGAVPSQAGPPHHYNPTRLIQTREPPPSRQGRQGKAGAKGLAHPQFQSA